MANTNGMAGDEIGAMYARLANRVETFADQSERFFNIISMLKDGGDFNGSLLTLDRLELRENHEIRIHDPAPSDVEEHSSVKPPTRARRKKPPAELPELKKPKVGAVNGTP